MSPEASMTDGRLNLEERYHELCGTPSDIFEHLPTFVELVAALNAEHVIELGTRSGVSTVAWLYGLKRTGGRLTSVDIADSPGRLGIDDHDDVLDRWEFVQGDDTDPAVFASLDMADIVFIDTSHHYRQTLSELNLYRWKVRAGGVMVLHDTELAVPEGAPPTDPRFPVMTALVEFCSTNGFEYRNIEGCWGLGIIKL